MNNVIDEGIGSAVDFVIGSTEETLDPEDTIGEYVLVVMDDKPITATSLTPNFVGCIQTDESDCGGVWFQLESVTFCETYWTEVEANPTWTDWLISPGENLIGTAKYWEGTLYNYSINYKVMCDSHLQSPIAPVVDRESYRCEPIITMYHPAGCQQTTAPAFTLLVTENPIWFGTLALFAGIGIAIAGKVSTLNFNLCLLVILGLTWGYCLSALIYGLLLAAFGIYSYSTLILVTSWSCMAGALLTPNLCASFVHQAVSFIGCYIFMRGLSLLFGGYPTELETFTMISTGEPILIEWPFWVYLAIFIVTYGYFAHTAKATTQ